MGCGLTGVVICGAGVTESWVMAVNSEGLGICALLDFLGRLCVSFCQIDNFLCLGGGGLASGRTFSSLETLRRLVGGDGIGVWTRSERSPVRGGRGSTARLQQLLPRRRSFSDEL